MKTWAHTRLTLAVVVLLALRCRPTPADHTQPAAARTPAPVSALERHVAATAPRGAMNCGLGRDAASDAAVDACGSAAFAHGRPFYAVFLPWPGPASDVVTSPTQLTTAYIGEARTISTVTQVGPSAFRRVTVCGAAARSSAPIRPLRGMRLPQFAPTGPLPQQPRRTAIIEVAVTADGRLADVRIVKPIAPATDSAALALVARSITAPARLFGIGVPVLMTVAVDDVDGTLVLRAPADPVAQPPQPAR